ncbi:class II aldolase/adducin family protein [Brevundimonas sp.]|uniref:class II aldolase/adducin family protein n=1 Tax=Brevundimonas sp. TaxID=1871086 RepID=UPI00262D86DD|nr:class II aldolase/adducin family protein [Brevundimonas sp.]
MTSAIELAKSDLAVANRILAHEGVMDAYGHVSVRHPERPDRFLLSRSLSPALVEAEDIMEFELDGTVVGDDPRPPYLERFIHGAIYAKRDDIVAAAHSHASEVLPFTVSDAPLRPAIHSSGVIGHEIPVWDIRDRFGDTNMLVVNDVQGSDLAERMGVCDVVLMRGHGFSAGARSLVELIRICVYLRVNATVVTQASQLGAVTYLSEGEVERIRDVRPDSPEVRRAWQYWATRAGCAHLVRA